MKTRTPTSTTMPAVLTMAALTLLCPRAASAQAALTRAFNMSVNGGVTYSDNVRRTSTEEVSETMIEAGLRLDLNREQGRLTADVGADLEYLTYLDNTYDDELVGGLDGTAVFAVLPDRFTWTVEDNFGQSFINPQTIDTPDNRQNTNYFSTGPDLVFPLGNRTNLTVDGRWSQTAYEEVSEFDSRRYSGAIGLVRLLESGSVSLNGTNERVEYDQSSPASSYDAQSYYLGYTVEGLRTTLELQIGYSAVRDYFDASNGRLLMIALVRRLSPRSTLSLDAGTDLTDSADVFRRDQGIGGVAVDDRPAVVTADPFQSDYATIAWDLESEHSNLHISADWRRETHERQTESDRERVEGSLAWTRRIRPMLSLVLSGLYGSEDFPNADVSYDEWTVGAGLDWQFARGYSLSLRGDHYSGTGDTSSGPDTGNYDENRIELRLSYSPTH